MADVLRQAPPIIWYTAVSVGLLGIVVARALDTYHNFFAAAFALSHSNGSIMVMANMAALSLYMFGRSLQFIFFGPLRPVEVERLYQRGGFFVTDFMLAFATFREAFGVSSGVMVAVLLFAKCFHWLLSDRIEAIEQLPYPGPSRLEHARLMALIFVLWLFDMTLFTYTVDAVMRQGIGLRVLFAAEYAILMVNLTQCVLKYALSVVEIRRAATVGGAIAPPWEEKPIYGFYIELSTAFIELTIYLSYFILMSFYHSIPIYAIRDVYVAGSLFFSRTLAFFRYKKAMQALDVYPTPTQQELDSKSDKTCIVCREELHVGPPEGASTTNNEETQNPPPDFDTSNGPPKRLPCGHIFHRNCLRSWFERQLTCPTCRRRVDEGQARAPGAAGVGVGGAAGALPGNNIAGDAARQQQNVPGGANGQRRAIANGVNGAQGTEAAPVVAMREPLRFEGFYLLPGAFVPWVGGQLLPRDPTQPNYPMARGFQQQQPQQQQQRPRHTPAPSANIGLANPVPVSAAPTPPTVTSPPPLSAATSTSFVWPPVHTPTTPAPTHAVEKTPIEVKSKASDDEDTSSDDSSDIGDVALQDRRRLATEAIMRRFNSAGSRSAAAPSATTTPTKPSGTIDMTAMNERAYSKLFALVQDTLPQETTRPAQTFSFNVPRPSTSTSTHPAQYNARHDAPSFIPLFHMFHQQQYGPIMGTSRPWPMQQAALPTQTLPFPGQNIPTISSQMIHPSQAHGTGVHRRPTSSRVHSSTLAQQQQSFMHTSNLQQTPQRSSILVPQRDIRREPSPSQEVSLQQLDSITRVQVEERLKVLENVKRMTQQCIEELMTVRGTMSGVMTRSASAEARPAAEQEVPITVETHVPPAIAAGIPPDIAVPTLTPPPPITSLVDDPVALQEVITDPTITPKQEQGSPTLELGATSEIISAEETAAEGTS